MVLIKQVKYVRKMKKITCKISALLTFFTALFVQIFRTISHFFRTLPDALLTNAQILNKTPNSKHD